MQAQLLTSESHRANKDGRWNCSCAKHGKEQRALGGGGGAELHASEEAAFTHSPE